MSEPVDLNTPLADDERFVDELDFLDTGMAVRLDESGITVRRVRLLPTGTAGERCVICGDGTKMPRDLCSGCGNLPDPTPAREPVAWRPEVRAMADAMEAKLRKHDAERGSSWKQTDIEWLLNGLDDEIAELRGAVEAGEGALWEAADVANYAMMIADRRGSLRATHPPTPEAGTVTEAMVEEQAQVVYAAMQNAMPEAKRYPWVERGNSIAQDESRRAARAILTAALAGRRGA